MSQPPEPSEAIEPASGADVDRLVECWLDLVAHGRAFGLHLRTDANELPARELLAAAVADDRILVARRDDRIVGFCTVVLESGGLERDATKGVVENLYVEPESRGAGLGSALLGAAEDRLADVGAEVVSVETMARDEDVRAFYEERDYVPHRLALEKPVSARADSAEAEGADSAEAERGDSAEAERDASRNQ